MKIIAKNRQATYHYELFEKYEAGIILEGSEIKSIRLGNVNLKDSYGVVIKGEAYILNMHIAQYKYTTLWVPEPERTRKLLLNKKEIQKIERKIKLEKLTLIPTKLYFNDSQLVKIEIALAKGKKLYDKRREIKQKDINRSFSLKK